MVGLDINDKNKRQSQCNTSLHFLTVVNTPRIKVKSAFERKTYKDCITTNTAH